MPMKIPYALENRTFGTIFMEGVRPSLQLGHSFSFVLNISRIVGQSAEAGLTIAPGHTLRKANMTEIVAIKDVLTSCTGITSWSAWEGGETIRNENNSTSRVRLPEDQWRYFVIEFKGTNETINEIERTLCITPLELKIGFTLLHRVFPSKHTPMLIYSAGRLFSQAQRTYADKIPFFDVTSAVAENIAFLRDTVQSCDQKLVNLRRITEQLLELDALPSDSPLLFLGYFAILESLLTHQPDPKDTIDSITRQVRRKIILLDNRWQPRIDYSQLPQSEPETIWTKMYSYRSCLAHGSDPDFKNKLQLLVDTDSALTLLKQTVKGVLRQALTEPQLIVDLRNC
jgi:hypothetical protein